MDITEQLSSRVGDRSEQANREAASRCLDDPSLLGSPAEALTGKDAALLGDCAEVFVKVAERQPGLVGPYFDSVIPLLAHRTTRVRWEAAHFVALTVEHRPDRAVDLLQTMAELARGDSSTIVRDYAIDSIGGIASTGPEAARAAYPLLQEALGDWNGKHASRCLLALARTAAGSPELAAVVMQHGEDYSKHDKPSVSKAAGALLRAVLPK